MALTSRACTAGLLEKLMYLYCLARQAIIGRHVGLSHATLCMELDDDHEAT